MSRSIKSAVVLLLWVATTYQTCGPSNPTGQPDMEGWARISIQGPGAVADGFANAFVNLPGSLDAAARGMRSLMTLVKGLGDPALLAKVDTARMQDLVNLTGGPGQSVAGDLRYDGLVTFKLEPREDGFFRLKEGKVQYSLRNGMQQKYRHGDEVVSMSLELDDAIQGRGQVDLDPARDQITLKMNVTGKDSQWDEFVPTYEFTLTVEHWVQLYGKTFSHFQLKTPMGTSYQNWDTQFLGETATHHLVVVAPPVLNQDETWDADDARTRQTLIYRQRGDLPKGEVARFTETGHLSFGGTDVWRNNFGGAEVGSFGIGLPGPDLSLECGPQWPELDEDRAARLRADITRQLTLEPLGAAKAHALALKLLSGSTFCDQMPSELFNRKKRQLVTLVALESNFDEATKVYFEFLAELEQAPASRGKVRDLLALEATGQLLGLNPEEGSGDALTTAVETFEIIGEREVDSAGVKQALAIAAEAQLLGASDDLSDRAIDRAQTVSVRELVTYRQTFDPCKAHEQEAKHLADLLARTLLLGSSDGEAQSDETLFLVLEALDNLNGRTPPQCLDDLPEDIKPLKIGRPGE